MPKPDFSQSTRMAELTTPLGEDKLLLSSFSVEEELGRPFVIEIEALSEDEDIDFTEILGHECSIRLKTIAEKERHFSGILTAAEWVGTRDRLFAYRLTLRPWLWLMTLSQDCKIFQQKSVVDIVLDTCRTFGFSDFELKTGETYRPLEYCVQYRETHFDFVSRLMEEFGIYYFFRHEKGKHTMVLCDGPASHGEIPDLNEVEYAPTGHTVRGRAEILTHWAKTRSIRTGQVTSRGYDFVQPTASMDSHLADHDSHPFGQMEVFDYGDKFRSGEADGHARHFVEARLYSAQSRDRRIEAAGDAPSLYPGGQTNLVGHTTSEENDLYLAVAARHSFVGEAFHSGSGGGTGDSYHGRYVFQRARRPFKSPQVTDKPVISGPQTATVVGPSGEEIYCDKYGRIKVQFHWDKDGKKDQNSSRWVRVAQMNWSSSTWGGMTIPRVGMEVVVEFIEGDPDRPLVVGSVFNGRNFSSYELPAHKTKMVMRSQTYKGSGHNEFSWEDNAGQENVLLRSQKDFTQATLNNYVCFVGANWATAVASNYSLAVGTNAITQVGHSQTNIVGAVGDSVAGIVSSLQSHTGKTKSLAQEASEKGGFAGAAAAVAMGVIEKGEKALLDATGLKGHNGVTQTGAQTAPDMGAGLAAHGANLTSGVGALFEQNGVQYNVVARSKIDLIGSLHAETVGAARIVNVGGVNYKKVAGVDLEIVGGSKFVKIAGGSVERVGGSRSVKVAENLLHKIGGNAKIAVAGGYKIQTEGALMQKAGGSVKVSAGEAVVIAGPGGTITIDASGVSIEGVTVNIKAAQINLDPGAGSGAGLMAELAAALEGLGESVLQEADAHHE